MYDLWNKVCMGYPVLARLGWGGIIMMFAGLVLIALIIYILFKRKDSESESKKETPIETLEYRFINGEINKEEYEEKIRVLRDRNL